jgi:hypothetical protein
LRWVVTGDPLTLMPSELDLLGAELVEQPDAVTEE